MADIGPSSLSEVAELTGGFAFKSEQYTSHGHFVLRTVNIRDDGSISRDGATFISNEESSEYGRFLLREHDTLFVMVGATLGKIGYIRQSDLPALLNQNMWVIRAIPGKADPIYLHYCFREISKLALTWVSGSARGFLRRDDIRNLAVKLPSLSEQRAIGELLRALDDKIDLNRRMNETLEAMARAIFRDWFVDFGPVRAKAEGRPPYLAPELWSLFPDALDDEDKPVGWLTPDFETLVDAKQGKYLSKDEMSDVQSGEFLHPVWGGNGVLGYSNKCAYPEPITLMTCRGSNCGLIRLTESSSLVSNNSFACAPRFGSTYFLYIYFMHETFDECISGSAQPQITYTALKSKTMRFPVDKIATSEYSKIAQPLFNKVLSSNQESKILAETRDFLLPKLMSGEIRLRDAEKAVEAVL